MMKKIACAGMILLAGCTTVKHQLTDPNVAARFDSAKSPEDFAACVEEHLVPPFAMEQNGTAYAFTLRRDIRLVSRWDIFPTNNGSQAELRNGAKDDAGVDQVRACAG